MRRRERGGDDRQAHAADRPGHTAPRAPQRHRRARPVLRHALLAARLLWRARLPARLHHLVSQPTVFNL